MPMKRHGYSRVGERPHRIGRAGRAILGVLVVVKEDPVTLFLPPFRSSQCGKTTFKLARQGDGGTAHFAEGPARLNTNIDMHSPRTAGLGPTLQSHLIEEGFNFERHATYVVP